SSAVYDTDFADGLSASFVRTVTNLALADAQFEIGGLFTDANGNPINGGEGSAGHMLLHALAGCAAAEASGADCKAGAAGGIAQSIYAGTDPLAQGISHQELDRRAALLGSLTGLLFSGGDAENVAIAASVFRSAVQNNLIPHNGDNHWAIDFAEEREEFRKKWGRENCQGLNEQQCNAAYAEDVREQLSLIPGIGTMVNTKECIGGNDAACGDIVIGVVTDVVGGAVIKTGMIVTKTGGKWILRKVDNVA
ncbi:hypothetical protein RA27_22990, partial [Ruegeria sp. ANG-R]|uniref:DUF637 domain-containing protein n=1 Tax=Ruegeria sp. ANG-R TaxID=1577903 RepID=UPI0005801174